MQYHEYRGSLELYLSFFKSEQIPVFILQKKDFQYIF